MKQAIFTIDVEGHVGDDPVEHLIYGVIDGKLYGIDLIMDICDMYQVKGLFFVDIAEAFDYGEEKIAKVLMHIKKRNHDVGVHIHPDHIGNNQELFLCNYSYSEQKEILKKCTDFYENVLGEKPKAFRAGKYGASWETLDILADLGYCADFSEFYGQRWCGISPSLSGTKSVVLESGLIEFPTMSFNNLFPGLFNRYDKIDVSMSMGEYVKVMKLLENDAYTNPIVLFAHSFSLMKWRRKPNSPKINRHSIKKLNKMLKYVDNNRNLEFVSLDDLLAREYDSERSLEVPCVKGLLSVCFMIPRAFLVMKMRFDIMARNFPSLFSTNNNGRK